MNMPLTTIPRHFYLEYFQNVVTSGGFKALLCIPQAMAKRELLDNIEVLKSILDSRPYITDLQYHILRRDINSQWAADFTAPERIAALAFYKQQTDYTAAESFWMRRLYFYLTADLDEEGNTLEDMVLDHKPDYEINWAVAKMTRKLIEELS